VPDDPILAGAGHEPAHAVLPRRNAHEGHISCPALQLGHAGCREDTPLARTGLVQLGAQVAAHIFGTGDELARRQRAGRQGQARRGAGLPEPETVPYRQAGLPRRRLEV
jgi:hypothetical protein